MSVILGIVRYVKSMNVEGTAFDIKPIRFMSEP